MAGVYSIPPDSSFVDALAKGVLAEAGDSPQALLDYTILLPTRRACRALRDAFLRASDGTSLLLPAMRPLGDVDEDELILQELPETGDLDVAPVIPGMRRRLMLARLILSWESPAGSRHCRSGDTSCKRTRTAARSGTDRTAFLRWAKGPRAGGLRRTLAKGPRFPENLDGTLACYRRRRGRHRHGGAAQPPS